MAWNPIALTVPQYEDSNGDPYSGSVLKAYDAGTTTNIPMATDSSGATTVGSIALNSDGYPEVGGAIVIPHLDQDYKLALYPTQAAADADSGAIWTIDNLSIGDDIDEWVETGDTLTFVSGNSFTVPGDQSSRYIIGRRIEITDIGGVDYYTIQSTSFAASATTVTVVGDNGATLASGSLAARFSIFRPVQESKSDPNTSAPVYDTQPLPLVGGVATVWPGPSLWVWAATTESLDALTDIAVGFPVTIVNAGAPSQVLTITASATMTTPEGRDIALYAGQSITLLQTGTTPGAWAVIGHSGRQHSVGNSVVTSAGSAIELVTEDDSNRFPPGLTRLNVVLNRISTTGVERIALQLGTSAGLVTTGYDGRLHSTDMTASVSFGTANGVPATRVSAAADSYSGVIQCYGLGTTWRFVVTISNDDNNEAFIGAGTVALGATMDRMSLLCGGDAFDGGSVHVEYA